jgi:hypothetical protein
LTVKTLSNTWDFSFITPMDLWAYKLPFTFVHQDYDGAEDANDHRFGDGVSIQDCIEQIQEL